MSSPHPLIQAARDGKLQDVRNLLQKGEANINETDEHGWTALIWASMRCRNHEVVVELLKRDEVDVNHQNNNGDTALIRASDYGFKEIVAELLKCDAVDVNLQNNNGDTALSIPTKRFCQMLGLSGDA
jgi:uncharacterized protein